MHDRKPYEVVIDHSVSFIVLMIDYSFNCIPFIWRHYFFSFIVILGFITLILVSEMNKDSLYPFIDWNMAKYIYIPFIVIAWTLLIELILVWLSRWKLRHGGKDMAVVQLKQIYSKIKLRNNILRQIKREEKLLEKGTSF